MNFSAECLIKGVNPFTNKTTDLVLKEALLFALGTLKD